MAKKRIDLQPYKDRGLIDVVECDAAEAAQVRARCCRFAELHTGELESLAILCRPGQDALFCTADGGAIRAAVMLDLTDRIVSAEELLRPQSDTCNLPTDAQRRPDADGGVFSVHVTGHWQLASLRRVLPRCLWELFCTAATLALAARPNQPARA